MRMVGPRPQVTILPTIRSARPPDIYLELLTQSEQEFQAYVRQVESQPAFQRLVEEGYVRKTTFRGRIPSHLYEEYQDQQFMAFMEEFEIEKRGDWQRDFFQDDARRRVKELAIKYQAPRGRLLHALEYCRRLKRAWAGYEDRREYYLRLDDPDFREPPTAQIPFESLEPYEELAKLMEEYNITQAEFVEYFMDGSVESEDIADALGIPERAVREICDLVDRVQLASSTQVTVVDTPMSPSAQQSEIVAIVQRFDNPPRAEIQVAAEVEYNSRYQIEAHETELATEETALLLDQLRLINQRKSLTFRIVMFIYEYQYRYFVGGNELHLKPLSQAELSRESGEHESTVSRILRGKRIETPTGVFSLKFFCQSKGDVIRRLITLRERQEIESGKRRKPYSDAELAEILEKEYDAKIARRTVTYYRNKFREAPKFYMRRRRINPGFE
jgi:transcriptional regulator with XRE-family HTH domain